MEIKYLVIDVDGTLTDGGVYYDENGNEWKKFNTRDGAGFFVARKAGIQTVVLTGRICAATTRRMKELYVDYLEQGIKDKKEFLEQFMKSHKISKEELGYVGDDLNDLAAMELAGYIACPADSCTEVKQTAAYVSTCEGGHGAFREIVEHLLREQGKWEAVISEVYGVGI